MKFIFALALLSVSTLSLAANYTCRVKGFSDYSVKVDTNKGASFFDNNEWIDLKFVGGSNNIEAIPAADFQYFFSVTESDGSTIDLEVITYKSKKRNPSGTISFMQDGKMIETKVFCKAKAR